MKRKIITGISVLLLLPLSSALACEHMPAMEAFLEYRGHISQTCTEPGKEDSAYCPECGALIREGAEIPPSGHTWSITAKPGTQTECLRCHTAITVPGTPVPEAGEAGSVSEPVRPADTPAPSPTPAPIQEPTPVPTPEPEAHSPAPVEYFPPETEKSDPHQGASQTDAPPSPVPAGPSDPHQNSAVVYFTPVPERKDSADPSVTDAPKGTDSSRITPIPDPVSTPKKTKAPTGETPKPATGNTGNRSSGAAAPLPGFSSQYPYRRIRMQPEADIFAPAAGILVWPLPEGAEGDSPLAQMIRNGL